MLDIKRFIASLTFIFTLGSLFAQDSCWVQVRIPVACIRDGKGHATEMTSQAIMGTPLLLLDSVNGEWLHIKAPDGYEGYMNVSSVAFKSSSEMEAWRKARRMTVTSYPEIKLYSNPRDFSSRNTVTELVNGSIAELIDSVGDMNLLRLPDGREGWAKRTALTPIEMWASQPFDADSIIARCYALMGTPYLWGACSTKSVDCSGLVRVSYFANGILTLRDARQQIEIGERISATDTAALRRGDLLFFSSTPEGRIGHVAIYDSDGRYIHSSGRIKTNVMSNDDPDFSNRVYRGASRIDGMIPSEGITQVIDHPWYF